MKSPHRCRCLLAFALAMPLALLAAGAVAKTSAHPELRTTTLDGKPFDLASERGKWVIVNFWATWCSPCIGEMPALSKFVATHKEVAAIGLAWDESDRKDILAFAKQHPVVYPLAQVDFDHPPASFDTPRVLPVTYLIAPDGALAATFTGPIRIEDLQRAIGEKRVAPAVQ